jgi:hypothetical protein
MALQKKSYKPKKEKQQKSNTSYNERTGKTHKAVVLHWTRNNFQ